LALFKIKFLLYIVTFFLCFILSATTSTNPIKTDKHPNDSLKIDRSEITPLRFDDFKKKYTDKEFIYEYDKNKSGWWTRLKIWLNDFLNRLFDFKNEKQSSKYTAWSLRIASIILVLLVVYFIFKVIINDEGKWVFGKPSDKNLIPINVTENNIQETNFITLIIKAENNNNYRLAIRYYYLWVIKQLAHAHIIDFHVEKTNSDYQDEITSKDLKKQFSYTSYLYNYIWYGEFKVNALEFEKAKKAFNKLINGISK